MTTRTLPHRPCSVANCEKRSITKGYCACHYQRVKKHGDPTFVGKKAVDPPELFVLRFWSRVSKLANGCWQWNGSVSNTGYGAASIGHRQFTSAHRAAWFFTYGRKPQGALLHSCDNRICVNPEHLREGSLRENIADMVAKSRQAKGEQCRSAKLTEGQVIALRMARKAGESAISLALKYGVLPSTVRRIVSGRTWKHLLEIPNSDPQGVSA